MYIRSDLYAHAYMCVYVSVHVHTFYGVNTHKTLQNNIIDYLYTLKKLSSG